jgi:hypothetical protein
LHKSVSITICITDLHLPETKTHTIKIMSRQFIGEIWKEVKFDVAFTNEVKIEVSNYGRVKSTTPQNGETILKGAMVSGYRIHRFKFFKVRTAKDQKRIDFLREQIALLVRKIGKLRTRNKAKRVKDKSYKDFEKKIKELTALSDGLKKIYQKEYKAIELKRTINLGGLVHRLVAEYFLDKPSVKHNLVAHLNHSKLDNRADNLKWMTREENVKHQMKSPHVIDAKKERFGKRFENTKVCKLTSTKVMLIKKKLNQGAKQKTLAKIFKVSEMQIHRIKTGENWAEVKAAT